ncbi:MAG TPA: biotin/lipoyl-binding protein, partial [Candidatus Binataceae bacterium]
MKKRLPILILVVLIAAGIGVYMWRTGQFAGPRNSIQVSGNLELTLVDISFKTAGRMIELNVREGDTVKKGQVIARLDAAQLEQQKIRDVAAIASAQSAYDQLRTTIEYQQATIDSDISTRRAEVAQAQAHLDELNAGSRTEEVQQADSSVNEARAQVDLARADWDRAQTLYKDQDISTSQYDQARTKFNAANA